MLIWGGEMQNPLNAIFEKKLLMPLWVTTLKHLCGTKFKFVKWGCYRFVFIETRHIWNRFEKNHLSIFCLDMFRQGMLPVKIAVGRGHWVKYDNQVTFDSDFIQCQHLGVRCVALTLAVHSYIIIAAGGREGGNARIPLHCLLLYLLKVGYSKQNLIHQSTGLCGIILHLNDMLKKVPC